MIKKNFPIIENKYIALDLETYSLNPRRYNNIFGVSLSVWEDLKNIKSYYWDIRQYPKVMHWLNDNLHKAHKIINHNLKFDIINLLSSQINVPVDNRLVCIMLRAPLIDEHLGHYDLGFLGQKYCEESKSDELLYGRMADCFGGNPTRADQAGSFHLCYASPLKEEFEDYAKQDTELALKLWIEQEKIFKKMEKEDHNDNAMYTIREALDLEENLFPHIIMNEYHGIRVDLNNAEKTYDELLNHEMQLLKKVHAEKKGLNCNSSKQLAEFFEVKEIKINNEKQWKTSCGSIIGCTDKGAPSFSAENLEKIKNPIARDIEEIKLSNKTRKTFIRNYIMKLHEHGRVYPHINQLKGEWKGYGDIQGTGPGRMSYSDPAMQNIPSRNPRLAKAVKSLFLPDEGASWANGDLEQHEVRVGGHFYMTAQQKAYYASDPYWDIHQWVADITGLPRKATRSGEANAKQVSIAMTFGMGPRAFAEFLGMSTEEKSFVNWKGQTIRYTGAGPEAQEILDNYYEHMPHVRRTYKKAKETAEQRGFIRDLYGRRLRFPNINQCYKAASLIYQASSASFNKRYLLEIYRLLKGTQSQFMHNCHDDYNISIMKEDELILFEIKDRVRNIAKEKLTIPIIVDFNEPANNWYEATISEVLTKNEEILK